MIIFKPSFKYIYALFFLLLIATAIRLVNINSIPVFADEAIYIRWSQVMKAEENLRFLPLSDGKQPLFMWITIPFLKLISDPLIAGRLVSVASGVGTLVGIFVLTYLLFRSYKISLTASLLYSILPFTVFFDRLALVDSLLSFFGIWTLIFSVLTVRLVRLDTAMIAGFLLGGALLTKSPAIYFVLLMPFTFMLSIWPKKNIDKFKRLCVYIFLFAVIYVIGFGFQNILRLGPNFHMIGLRNSDYVYPIAHILSSPFDPFMPFIIRNFEYIWVMGTPLFTALLLVGIYFGIKKLSKETILVIIWGVVPILISSEFSKTMTARYIYPSVPYLIILASIWYGDRISENKFKWSYLTYPLAAILVAWSIYYDILLFANPKDLSLPRSERSGYLEDWTSGYGIKEVGQYLRNERQRSPNEKIVVGTEGYFGTLPDGLQIYLNDIPDITIIGVGQPLRSLPDSLKNSKVYGNRTFLVINKSRLLEDSGKMGLVLINAYPKAQKPDGQVDELLFFELVDVQRH